MTAGLTGGMGSGKTTVARIFRVLGCAVFMSDEAARAAYLRDDVKAKIRQLLGGSAYMASGELDRKFVAGKVFAEKKLLEAVNAIIHPVVGELFAAFVQNNRHKVVIKESALLFEAKVAGGLDKIIVVASPDELRIDRVMKRDGASRAEVEARLGAQLPQEEKIQRADFVVHNDERQLLIPQVNRIFTLLRSNDQEGLPGKTI